MKTTRRRLLVAATLPLLTWSAPAAAQTLPAGPQVLTFFSEVDDTEQPYALYLPRNYDASRRYPLVVSLHGAGSNHRLNLRRVFGRSNAPGETDVEASRYFPAWPDVDFIVVSPFARGTMGYQGIAEKDVLDALADVKRRFSVDEDRVYLTGLSMGGGGALWIGLSRPDIWAAIAPVCPAPPEGAELLAPNALQVPMRIFHGDADAVVRPEGVRAWVNRLRELGTRIEYTEYPGVGHDSWVNAYENGQIFEWFAQHRRNPHPDRVRFTTDRYRHRSAYWVELDALTPGTHAQIDARFTAPNRVDVTTTALDGFTLRVEGHPRRVAGQPLVVRIDGREVRAPAGEEVSFRRSGRRWEVGRAALAEGAKRPGAEGPLSEAFSERHVYVFGTAGEPPPEELQRRRQQAEAAAHWSAYRGAFLGRVMVFPRVLADREVRPSDLESANLVLFGTRETNALIARFADRLPIHLSGDTRDMGLVYVFPVGERYVVVNSGLPWWTLPAAQPAGPPVPGARRISPFAATIPAFALQGFPDYVLFRGSLNEVVAEGRFDERWQLPAPEAQRLRATGAVVVSPAPRAATAAAP